VQLRTPGVYTEEVATLPPSVAEVSTAIPAFIGYVERGDQAARIGGVLDYQARYGTAKPAGFTARIVGDDPATPVTFVRADDAATETLFYAVSHYFANGGGPCWIVPIGGGATAAADFAAGLDRVEQEDEPTLLLFPQAADRLEMADYGALATAALNQCNRLKDRFVVLDVPRGETGAVAAFRDAVNSSYLSYAAAYHPYLQTTLSWVVDDASVTVEQVPTDAAPATGSVPAGGSGIAVTYAGTVAAPRVRVVAGNAGAAGDPTLPPTFRVENNTLVIGNGAGRTGAAIAMAWDAASDKPAGFTLAREGDGSGVPSTGSTGVALITAPPVSGTLASLKTDKTALYNRIREALARERVTLPPSPAVAGAYASVDRDRGVWKAPANVGLAATIGPVVRMTDVDQETLNVDTAAGKSINAIRAFAGRGTMIWGARTLAGNDNEWRYVPVRRLFITIEESTRKASAFAVFEPNDATTWMKVKGMIESYLYGLWERGALAGAKPDAAYYVQVGLGRTMTAQDVLEGRMIVEVGIAAVRPAEFVVLRFAHRLQQG